MLRSVTGHAGLFKAESITGIHELNQPEHRALGEEHLFSS
jgi:hypothetical protein